MTKEINQWNVKHTKHSQKKGLLIMEDYRCGLLMQW